MAPRSTARYLAPTALVACAVVVVIVVGNSGGGGAASTRSRAVSSPAGHGRHRGHRVYLVRPGDTLSRVAARTGVPIDRMTQLNPRLDVNALHPGQRIKLR